MLPDLIEQLESLGKVVRSLYDDDTILEVVSLSKNSPIKAVFRPVRKSIVKNRISGTKKTTYRQLPRATAHLKSTLAALTSESKLPRYADEFALTQLKSLAQDLAGNDSEAIVTTGGTSFSVGQGIINQISLRLGASRIGYTTYVGKMGRINAHGAKWSFTIFPIAGPRRIVCYFDRTEIERMRGFVNEVVQVKGRAIFRGESAWPAIIYAELVSIKGAAPDGFWSALPSALQEDWESVPDNLKELARMERAGA